MFCFSQAYERWYCGTTRFPSIRTRPIPNLSIPIDPAAIGLPLKQASANNAKTMVPHTRMRSFAEFVARASPVKSSLRKSLPRGNRGGNRVGWTPERKNQALDATGAPLDCSAVRIAKPQGVSTGPLALVGGFWAARNVSPAFAAHAWPIGKAGGVSGWLANSGQTGFGAAQTRGRATPEVATRRRAAVLGGNWAKRAG